MIQFTITGIPKAKGRPKFRSLFASGIATKIIEMVRDRATASEILKTLIKTTTGSAYTPPETAAAQEEFAWRSKKYSPRDPLKGPLRVDAIFVMPKPARFDADRSRIWPHVKPDEDNLRKLVLDALNGIFWHDDGQVCAGESFKVYAGTPRTFVRIRQLTQEDHNRVLEMLGEPVAQASLIGG